MWFPEVTLINVALLLSVILYFFYKYLSANFNYWKDRGLVQIKPVIFVGAYKDFFLLRSNAGEIYRKIYNQYSNEKLVGSFRMRTPELMVKDPDLIKQVLVKDFSSFADRSNDVVSDHEGINTNLFRVQGERWKAMRVKLTPAFTSIKLKNMFPLIVEKGEEFQKFLEQNLNVNDELNVIDLTARFTTDVISSCAFGVQAKSMDDSNSSFRNMGKKIFQTTKWKVFKSILGILSPKMFVFFRMKLIPMEVEDFFVSTMREITTARLESNVKRQDFVDILLELKQKGYVKSDSSSENIIEFTDMFMAAQAFIFFAAGFETSSTLMACTLYELAMNPDIQEKVMLDINNALKKNGGIMSYETIADMHYLECAISETMRKYPALGTITRVCGTTYTFPGTNLTIEKDCSIAIPVQALHYDPEYYPDPEKFRPERFTPEAKQTRHPMVYLPFGEGPRNCIGLRFGKMQSMVGLVSLLTKFSVEPSAKTESKLTINPMAFVTVPKYGVWLKIKQRK